MQHASRQLRARGVGETQVTRDEPAVERNFQVLIGTLRHGVVIGVGRQVERADPDVDFLCSILAVVVEAGTIRKIPDRGPRKAYPSIC